FHVAGMFILTHPLDPITYQGIPEMAGAAAKGLWQFASTGSLEGAPGIYEQWGPVKRGLEYVTNPTAAMEKMLARSGLTGSAPKMLDAYHDLMHPEKKNVFQDVVALHNRALWDRLWRGVKAYEAVETGQRLLKEMENEVNPRTGAKYTPQEIVEGVADFYNKKYGGLNWDRMGTAQQTRLNMRSLLFAPDWLLANTMYTADGMKGILDLRAGRDTIQSHLAIKDLTTLAVTWMTLTQAVSLFMNGHTTWDNEPGHEFQLEVPGYGLKGQRRYLDVTTPAAFLTLTHLLAGGVAGARIGTGLGEQNVLSRSGAAVKGIGDRVKSLLVARLAYLPRTAVSYLTNTSFGGRPLLPGTTLGERVATGVENLGFQALPFTVQSTLRATPLGGALPGGQITPQEAASQLAGVGAPSVGASTDKIVWDRGLTRLNKAQFFQQLSDLERREFLRQSRTGQFSGTIAQKLRAAADRQQAMQTSSAQRETRMLEHGQIQEAIRSMAARGVSLPTIRTKILPYLLRQLAPQDRRMQQAVP